MHQNDVQVIMRFSSFYPMLFISLGFVSPCSRGADGNTFVTPRVEMLRPRLDIVKLRVLPAPHETTIHKIMYHQRNAQHDSLMLTYLDLLAISSFG